ncbi:hypothetical protein FGB62_195g01 [Gracilaria domingensis]|nr:hypothetical protein FGB62_195g01 [Gracilaria domingensis]
MLFMVHRQKKTNGALRFARVALHRSEETPNLHAFELFAMIELPFGNGITAAILFFVFELVFIPILIDSTSRAASFLVDRRANKDIHIRVSSLPYPLWNEGLLSREWSHLLLFLFRMTCIAIPVYLETRLEYREQPVMVTRSLPNAFVITSKVELPFNEQVLLQNETSDFSNVLNTCSFIDEEGWLVARLANVTYVPGEISIDFRTFPQFEEDFSLDDFGNEPDYDSGYSPGDETEFETSTHTITSNLLYEVFCIDGTEETLFRVIEAENIRETDPYSRDPNITLHLSPEIVDSFSVVNHLKIDAIVSDGEGIDCFIPVLTTWFQSGKTLTISCHKKLGKRIFFYTTSAHVDVFREQNSSIVTPAEALVNIVPESFTVMLQFVAAIEFKEQIMLDAEFLMKQEDPVIEELDSSLSGVSRLYHALGIYLYTKTENESVTMAGESVHERTILDRHVIIIGGIELSVIILFELVVRLCFFCCAHEIQKPNTVEGLSESWSRAITPATTSVKNSRVRLKLRKRTVRGVERYVYEPVADEDREQNHNEGVLDLIVNSNG